MSNNLNDSIKKSIERLKDENIENLYSKGTHTSFRLWTNFDLGSLKEYIIDTIDELINLNSKGLIDELNLIQLNQLDSQLKAFYTQLNTVKNLNLNQITTQHHAPLNTLKNIDDVIQTSGLRLMDKLSPDIPKKNELIEQQLSNVNDTKSKVDALYTKVNQLISPSVAKALSTSFGKRKSTINYQKWFWAFVTISGGLFTIHFTNSVVDKIVLALQGNENSIGLAVLRSLVLLPLYALIIFTISQYRKERRFEEIYAHKSAISEILPIYSKQIDSPSEKDKVFMNASNILFELPEPTKSNNVKERKMDKLNEDKSSIEKLMTLDEVEKLFGLFEKMKG